MTSLPLLEDLGDVRGKRVLVRTDFNVPMSGADDARVIVDDFRIVSALPTINYLTDRGATVVCASHLGRPKGAPSAKYSMAPVRVKLAEIAPGVELLENLRFNPGEEANDPKFVAELVAGFDFYVDDAFGATHRAHASIVGPPKTLPSAAGRLLQREIEVLGAMREKPNRPFVAVLGGAKVSDKIGVIEALQERVDAFIIGGGMCFTFLAAKGYPVGDSICQPELIDVCKKLLDGKVPIHLPEDIAGLDAGGVYATYGIRLPKGAKGMFEDARFANGTRTVAQAMADTKAFTVVGGGDSAAALAQFKLDDEVDHVSTGGGASLEYLELGDLPGLEALRGAPRVK
jgi:phosphoglycerate kinase